MKKFKMQLFGSFSITGESGAISEETFRSGKLTNLLIYLLMHRDQPVSQQKLIEAILDSDTKNPENTLRNLMYRIRNEMKMLGDEKFICTLPGAYQWNPEFEVDADYDRFELLCAEVDRQQSKPGGMDDELIRGLCSEAIECYGTNVTEKIANEMWIFPKAARFRTMYLDIVKILCELLHRKEEFEELEHLCRKALETDQYDEELHCWLIRSLYRQKRTDQAVRQYEMAKRLFYEHLGISEMEMLKEVYQEMLSDKETSVIDINKLMSDIREEEKPQGSFFCDYRVFKEIYRIEARRIDRLGIAEYMVLLTLRRTSDLWQNSVTDTGLLNVMKDLESSVSQSLRISDVATRFSPTQILILLPGCSYENSLVVVERIRRNFKKYVGKKHLELFYEVEEISDDEYTLSNRVVQQAKKLDLD